MLSTDLRRMLGIQLTFCAIDIHISHNSGENDDDDDSFPVVVLKNLPSGYGKVSKHSIDDRGMSCEAPSSFQPSSSSSQQPAEEDPVS